MQEEKEIKMEVVNFYAAGIDIGSRFHFVAIGQKKTDVKEFGVFNEDLFVIAKWLNDNCIKTAAIPTLPPMTV
jgi:transposase